MNIIELAAAYDNPESIDDTSEYWPFVKQYIEGREEEKRILEKYQDKFSSMSAAEVFTNLFGIGPQLPVKLGVEEDIFVFRVSEQDFDTVGANSFGRPASGKLMERLQIPELNCFVAIVIDGHTTGVTVKHERVHSILKNWYGWDTTETANKTLWQNWGKTLNPGILSENEAAVHEVMKGEIICNFYGGESPDKSFNLDVLPCIETYTGLMFQGIYTGELMPAILSAETMRLHAEDVVYAVHEYGPELTQNQLVVAMKYTPFKDIPRVLETLCENI